MNEDSPSKRRQPWPTFAAEARNKCAEDAREIKEALRPFLKNSHLPPEEAIRLAAIAMVKAGEIQSRLKDQGAPVLL